jgi:agmatine/peptidylarginine deiminase
MKYPDLHKRWSKAMSASKQELRKVVGELSEDESRILLKFAEWLREQKEELTDKELAILHRGEKQIREGDFVWWRDVRRTNV